MVLFVLKGFWHCTSLFYGTVEGIFINWELLWLAAPVRPFAEGHEFSILRKQGGGWLKSNPFYNHQPEPLQAKPMNLGRSLFPFPNR